MKHQYDKLRGRIIEKYSTQEKFASILNVSNQTISRKMNGLSRFSQNDIITWCEALDIKIKDAGVYFF